MAIGMASAELNGQSSVIASGMASTASNEGSMCFDAHKDSQCSGMNRRNVIAASNKWQVL